MTLRTIRTTKEYEAALRILSAYFDNEPESGSEEGERFEILAALVEAYETRHSPVEAAGQALVDRLAASPASPEQWSRDTAFVQDEPLGRELL
jgi:antitoxin component HigA of HigAB toxin-antitoxin module